MQKVELFKPEDFEGTYGHFQKEAHAKFAEIANKKLQKYIESCPVVYFKYLGGEPFNLGPLSNEKDDTHTARLAFIEDLPKEKPKVSDVYEYQKAFNDKVNAKAQELLSRTGNELLELIEEVLCIKKAYVKEPCEHKPFVEYHPHADGVYPKYAKCEVCGVKLEAEWKEVK